MCSQSVQLSNTAWIEKTEFPKTPSCQKLSSCILCPSVHLELYTLLLPKYTSKFAQYKDKKPKTLVQRSPDFTVNMFISVYLSHSVTKNLCLNVISALFPFGCKQHCTAHELGPGRLRMVSFTCTCGEKIMIKMEKRYSFWKRWKQQQPHNALVCTCVCKSPTRVRVSKETWPKNESQIKWVF